jgi:hypothetical protein
MKHIVCYSGGHSSALVAIEVVRRFGKQNVILLNHDINPSVEDIDIKRFKNKVADYLGLPITYANINGIDNPNDLPDQFDVCMEADAMTDNFGHALCTNRLKTKPFYKFLNLNFPVTDTLFEKAVECMIYYGFDANETVRIQRRTGILGAMNYKTDYVLAFWEDRTIFSTNEIGIEPPSTYSVWRHANCKGCLKAGLLHWYVTYCNNAEIYSKGEVLEESVDFTIHTVERDGVKMTVTLKELRPIFEQLKCEGFPATEHQSDIKFANMLRRYGLKDLSQGKPCECLS